MTAKKWINSTLFAAALGVALSSAALIAQPTDGQESNQTERLGTSTKPVITITESGTNARQLRYSLSPGSEAEFRIVNTMSIEGQQGEGQAMSQSMPTISQGVLATVESVSEDGVAKIKAVMKSIDVDAGPGTQQAMVAMFRQQLRPLVGLEVTYQFSERGEVSELKLSDPSIMQGQLGQFAEQFMQNIQSAAVVLPEGPVGNNGQWIVSSESEMFAIKAKQEAEFTVASMSENGATVDYSMKVTADPQRINDPSLPPGMEAELEAFDSNFNGQYTIDLSKPVAKGTVTSTMTIRTKVNQMGQEMRMRQTVSSTVAVTDPENNEFGDE